MDFLKTTAGKVVTAGLTLAVVASGISWWSMDQATRQMLITGTGRIVAWLGVVLLLPWASFLFIGWVGRRDSNLAGALLVSGYTLAELLLLLRLFDWSLPGAAGKTFAGVGLLVAGVYNLFVCDWIAEKAG